MLKDTTKDTTLLLGGPASFTPVRGKVEALGVPVRAGKRVVVRKGRSLPLWVTEDTSADIVLGPEASMEEISGNTIPTSWVSARADIMADGYNKAVVVLGAIDSGKTTFCTYVLNGIVSQKRRATVVDADLGQSDIGPPTTFSVGLATQPVFDMFNVKMVGASFVGVNSPSLCPQRALDSLIALRDQMAKGDLTIVNTDGWICGPEAEAYKVRLVKEFNPVQVIAVQKGNELEGVLKAVEQEGFEVARVESPAAIRPRDKEERKQLREQGYYKFLKNANLRTVPFAWVTMENTVLGRGAQVTEQRFDELGEMLNSDIEYCEEDADDLLVVFRGAKPDTESLNRLPVSIGKRVHVVAEGDERGLLVGLLDENRTFAGIGVIFEINYSEQNLKIHTPVRIGVNYVQFGRIVLNKYGKELGVSTSLCL